MDVTKTITLTLNGQDITPPDGGTLAFESVLGPRYRVYQSGDNWFRVGPHEFPIQPDSPRLPQMQEWARNGELVHANLRPADEPEPEPFIAIDPETADYTDPS